MPGKKKNETLSAIVKELCKAKLDSNVDDRVIELAIKHQLVMQATLWGHLSAGLIEGNIDPRALASSQTPSFETLRLELDKFVVSVVSEVNYDLKMPPMNRPLKERLIKDYFFPTVFKSHAASTQLLEKIHDKVIADPSNQELINYQDILISDIAHLDAIANLPFALEKLTNSLRGNTGKNYTPNENALLIKGLLDALQKSGEGHWSVEKLLQVVRFITQVTMPDLPIDGLTLESIKELLSYVNDVIDKSRRLEQQKTILFLNDNPKQMIARKSLWNSMGIEFLSLGQICQRTLRQPVVDALKATGDLGEQLSLVKTEDGVDYLHLLNTLDQVGNVINGTPQPLLPQSLRPYANKYVAAMKIVGQVSSAAVLVVKGTGEVVREVGSELGSQILEHTSDKIKAKADGLLSQTAQVTKTIAPSARKVLSILEYITPYHYTPYVNKKTYLSIGDKLLGAASYFIPAYIKNKFSKPDSHVSFWQSLQPSTETLEPNIAEAFFYFHALQTASNSPALEEDFFNSFLKKSDINATYSDYLSFKIRLDVERLSSPLKEQLELFEDTDSEDQYESALYMLHRIKALENEITQYSPLFGLATHALMLHEFKEALEQSPIDQRLATFQMLYIRPAFEKGLLSYEKQQFILLLEQALDLGHEQLRDIYSKLMGGQRLTSQELSRLKRFSRGDVRFTIDENIESITRAFVPVQSEPPAQAKTSKEASRHKIQSTLDAIFPLCNHISEGIAKQIESCKGLKALCPNDPLKSLCDSKIIYLEKLQQSITKLLVDIKSDDTVLAEYIRKIISGENEADLLAMADATTIAKQLLTLWLEDLLPTSGLLNATTSEKILAYALSSNGYLNGIVEAKHQFEKAVEATPPPPELMKQLGNPFHFVGVNEDVVNKTVFSAIDQTRTALIQPLATYYVAGAALGYVFTHTLLADIALGVLLRPSVQKEITSYLGSVGELLSDVSSMISEIISPYQQKLAEPIKDVICSMLDIEVMKILEQKAYKYAAASSETRSTLNKGERDAFSGFYLQYRAIKKNNPQLDRGACVQYLFPSLLEHDLTKRQQRILELSTEFDRLDRVYKDPAVPSKQESELEKEMNFLITTIDFDSTDENTLVGMTIFNRLVMMHLEASKHLPVKESRKLQQKAVGNLESVLKNLEEADSQTHSTEIRVNSRAEQFAPATKLAAQIKFNILAQDISIAEKLIASLIADRERQIQVDLRGDEPKLFGMKFFEAEMAKHTKLSIAVRLAIIIAKIAAPIVLIALIALGFAGVMGAVSASTGMWSLGLLAAVTVLGVAHHTFREIRAHDNEFQAINNNDSRLKRVGIAVKCFFLGILGFLNSIYQMYTSIPIVLTDVGELSRHHPTSQTLHAEKQVLGELQTKLEVFKALVFEQIEDKKAVNFDSKKPDPATYYRQGSYDESLALYNRTVARSDQIEALSNELTTAIDTTHDSLVNYSQGDARWQRGVNQEIEDYRCTFTQLKDSVAQVNIVQNVESKMRPQMTSHEHVATQHATKAEAQLRTAVKLDRKLRVEKDKILLELSSDTHTDETKKQLLGIRKLVTAIGASAAKAGEEVQQAHLAVRKSGEVGFFSSLTAITGPAKIAYNKANRAWLAARKIDTDAQELLKNVEEAYRVQSARMDEGLDEGYDEPAKQTATSTC